MKGKDFIEKLGELIDSTPSKDLPYGYEVMDVIGSCYDSYSLLQCFDNDDMLDYLEGTTELDNYIEEQCEMAIKDYQSSNPLVTHQDIIRNIQDSNKYNFKRFLCDLVDANYHTSNEQLIEELVKRI